jgi:hypothetical protein
MAQLAASLLTYAWRSSRACAVRPIAGLLEETRDFLGMLMQLVASTGGSKTRMFRLSCEDLEFRFEPTCLYRPG